MRGQARAVRQQIADGDAGAIAPVHCGTCAATASSSASPPCSTPRIATVAVAITLVSEARS